MIMMNLMFIIVDDLITDFAIEANVVIIVSDFSLISVYVTYALVIGIFSTYPAYVTT